MLTRSTALLDFDPSAPFFDEPVAETPTQAVAQQNQPAASNPKQAVADTLPVADKPVEQKAAEPVVASKKPAQEKNTEVVKPATQPSVVPTPKAKPVNNLFSLPGEGEYYFVVNVTEAKYNLSSSRFGIGQFNRTRYAGTPLRHQLQEVSENQLIFIGTFKTFEDVKTYESTILPLIKDIMKVPAEHYSTFAITKEGLDKLKSRQLIDSYIEFYKNSN
jgi:hypothetical protein